MADIAQRLFQPHPTALIASGLLDAVEVAELAPRGVVRLVRWHPGGAIGRRLHFEVRLHFRGHVGLNALSAKERTESMEELHCINTFTFTLTFTLL
jgi:hypothetical protein